MNAKGDLFETILNQNTIDLELLKKISYAGILMKHRAKAYIILLDVLGLDGSTHDREIQNKFKKYEKYFGDKPFLVPEEATSNKSDSEISEYKNRTVFHLPKKLLHQIHIDVLRINPIHRQHEGKDMSYIFYNILEITAHKRPYIGYIQGMADLIVPFSHLFFKNYNVYSESLIYFCYSHLINRIQCDIFDLQAEIMASFERTLISSDYEVYVHLQSIGLDSHMYCYRWFNCLFVREFPIDLWFRIFDSMLCSCIKEFVVFFGVSLLIWFRKDILSRDFTSNIMFMQNLHEQNITAENIEEMIGTVSFLKRQENAKK